MVGVLFCFFFSPLTYNFSFLFLPWQQLLCELWLELVSMVLEAKQGGVGVHEVIVVLQTWLLVPYLWPCLCWGLCPPAK